MSFRDQQPRRVSESLRWNAHVVMFSSAGTPSFRACLALVSAGAAVGGVASVDVPPPPSARAGPRWWGLGCSARLLSEGAPFGSGRNEFSRRKGHSGKGRKASTVAPPPRDSAPHPPSAATPDN